MKRMIDTITVVYTVPAGISILKTTLNNRVQAVIDSLHEHDDRNCVNSNNSAHYYASTTDGRSSASGDVMLTTN